MKKITLFCFLVFSTLSFAQAKIITGTIKDANTNEPIDIVSISIISTNSGTISNSDGNYKIAVPEGYNKLSFSHLGYETKEYEVKGNATVEIQLKPKEYLLNEVVVNGQPTAALIHEVDSISRLKLRKAPYLLNTYCRELVKEGDKYIRFADGILDYYIDLDEKQKHMNSQLSVKQSRCYDNRNLFASQDQEEMESYAIQAVGANVADAYSKIIILADTVHYGFHIKTKTDADKNNIGVISITPKKGIEVDGVEIGTITYDVKTKLILDVDLRQSPEHKQYSVLASHADGSKTKINDFAYKVSFRIDGDKYFMNYYQFKYNVDLGVGEEYNTFEYVMDVTTLDYKTVDSRPRKFKPYKKRGLSANGNKYTEEFWKIQNIRLLSDEEEKIINDWNQKSASTAKSTSE